MSETFSFHTKRPFVAEADFQSYIAPDVTYKDKKDAKVKIVAAVDELIANYELASKEVSTKGAYSDWMGKAACQNAINVYDYLEVKRKDLKLIAKQQAVKICAVCVVRDECLSAAIESDDKHPYRGGKTLRERNKIRRNKKTVGEAGEAA